MMIKNLKIIALIIVFLLSIRFSHSNESIIPKKKPTLAIEILEKKISKNFLIPQKIASIASKEIFLNKKESKKSME